jgi:cytochrome d ubiquinol oxidase subunit I
VQGVLRTADAVSPVTTGSVLTSLLVYISVYSVVFTAGALFILRLMAEGPVAAIAEPDPRGQRAPGSALARAPDEADGAEGDTPNGGDRA